MFKIIEPHDHFFYEDFVNPFLKTIKENEMLNRSFQDCKNATFIVFKDELKGVYGGALLLKQKLSNLHKKIGKRISPFSLPQREAWTCTTYLYMSNNTLTADFESLYITFYKGLYQKLVEFGNREGLSFLCMTLEPYFYPQVSIK